MVASIFYFVVGGDTSYMLEAKHLWYKTQAVIFSVTDVISVILYRYSDRGYSSSEYHARRFGLYMPDRLLV
jgi:hypothetical protein